MTMQKKYIEDENGNKVLPITHFSAVKNSSGDTLEDVLYTESTYDPTTYSGMGRKVLQKNMVNGVNTLTQDMMPVATGGNTIYIIRYDFTLGEDVTVPANCVLEFDGGSINGEHSLTFNNTLLCGSPKIAMGCACSGSVKNKELHVEWFGAVGDGTYDSINSAQGTDNRPAFMSISHVINASGGGKIIFEYGKSYACSVERYLKWGAFDNEDEACLYFRNTGDVHIDLNGSTILIKTNINNSYQAIHFWGSGNCSVINGGIIGDGEKHSYVPYEPDNLPGETKTSYEWCHGIQAECKSLVIDNLNIQHCCGDAICCGSFNAWGIEGYSNIVMNKVIIQNCELSYCGRQGISLHSTEGTIIENNKIHHIGTYGNNPGFAPMSGIDIEYEEQIHALGSLIIRDCYIHDTTNISIATGKSGNENSKVTDCLIENCIFKSGIALVNLEAVTGERKVVDCDIDFAVGTNYISAEKFDNCNITIPSGKTDFTVYLDCPKIENCTLINNNNPGCVRVHYYGRSNFYNCLIKGFKSTAGGGGKYYGFNGASSSFTINGDFFDTKLVNTDIIISNELFQNTEENNYIRCSFDNCYVSFGKKAYLKYCDFNNCQTGALAAEDIVFEHCNIRNSVDIVGGIGGNNWPQTMSSFNFVDCHYDFCNIYSSVQPVMSGQSWELINNSKYRRCIFEYDNETASRVAYNNMIDCTKIGIS